MFLNRRNDAILSFRLHSNDSGDSENDSDHSLFSKHIKFYRDGEFLNYELEINQDVEVSLIITDYCMPGMTGYDLLKKKIKVSF
ncbi:Two-component response regulator ARR9 [Senna tora]|uniref:Two-component response regulator ARR9 n=1 Tax=Senna tora TaxID=362788 RepID=A0A834THI7_9FABA|nr:Two-component response regulator ARR9 [Senna tora]